MTSPKFLNIKDHSKELVDRLSDGQVYLARWKEGKKRKCGSVIAHEIDCWDHPDVGRGATYCLHRSSAKSSKPIAKVSVNYVSGLGAVVHFYGPQAQPDTLYCDSCRDFIQKEKEKGMSSPKYTDEPSSPSPVSQEKLKKTLLAVRSMEEHLKVVNQTSSNIRRVLQVLIANDPDRVVNIGINGLAVPVGFRDLKPHIRARLSSLFNHLNSELIKATEFEERAELLFAESRAQDGE